MCEPKPRFTMDEVLDLLERAPGRLAAATAGRTPAALLEPLQPGAWSARDILGHVRACDRTWGAYLERILDEDRPSFRAESPRSTIRQTDFLALPFGTSLAAFTADRARLVERLRSIGDVELARTAAVRLPGRGTEDRTAAYYAHRIADHELEHVEHLERVAAAAGS